jgi:hypothetical protein
LQIAMACKSPWLANRHGLQITMACKSFRKSAQ